MSLPRVAREAVTLPRNPGIHAGEVHADCPVASAAKPMVMHARVGAFVVNLTVAEA